MPSFYSKPQRHSGYRTVNTKKVSSENCIIKQIPISCSADFCMVAFKSDYLKHNVNSFVLIYASVQAHKHPREQVPKILQHLVEIYGTDIKEVREY